MSITFPSSPVNGQTFLTKGRGWQYNSTSGSWEALVRVNTAFDSDDIQEGTNNLYLNTENIQDSVANLLTAGNNISINYNDAANSLSISAAGVSGQQNLIPDVNNTRDIGSSTLKYKDLYLAGNASIGGNTTIQGTLTVTGTTTTINSTELSVNDLNITIASGAATALDADGAGITIAGANATMLYAGGTDRFVFNRAIEASTFHGNVTGNVSGSAGTVTSLGNRSIGDLSDVDITTSAPGTGNMLTWDGSKFTPATPYSTSNFNTDFGTKTTSDLSEGSNLYFTDSRARSSLSLGTAGSRGYNSTTGAITIPGTTDHITEGTNLFYTNLSLIHI